MKLAKQTTRRLGAILPVATAAALLLAVGPALAVTSVTLCARPFDAQLPQQGGGVVAVPMWGYTAGGCAGTPTAPGPVITVPAGETTLQVTLINQLTVPTSIVLASQRLPVDGGAPVMAADIAGPSCVPNPAAAATDPAHPQNCRVRSFTGETEIGAARTYTFTNLRPGTYLYQSGTHPQVQIQMGLAGMARIGATSTAVAQDVPVVLSEVDSVMHGTIAATLGTAGSQGAWQAGQNSTLKYAPDYFLVNGRAFDGVSAGVAATDLGVNFPNGAGDQPVRLRIANAGLESRSLVLNSGTWKAIGENGYAYPAPREQASLLVPAGTTADADLTVTINGAGAVVPRLAFFDRRTGTRNGDSTLAGGLIARVTNSTGPALAPIADQIVNEGTAFNLQVLGWNVASYSLPVAPVGMAITSPGGAITWAVPTGAPSTAVQVDATNGSTVSQTFAVNVNHTPIAVADGTQATPFKTITLNKSGSGINSNGLTTTPGLTFASGEVTLNDSDPDVVETPASPWVPSNVVITGVTLVAPVNGGGVGPPTVTAPSGVNWAPASASYDAATKTIHLKPINRIADGLVVRNSTVSCFGVYRIDYRVTDQYGLTSNVASAFILVN